MVEKWQMSYNMLHLILMYIAINLQNQEKYLQKTG